MGAADETSPDAAAEGTLTIIRSTLNRALHVNLRDASGNEVAVGGGTQYDEDTAATAAEKVTMAGVVRQDTAASLVGTDGDRTELIVGSTALVFLTLLQSIMTANLVSAGKAERAHSIDRHCRWIFPLAFALWWVVILV